MTRAPLMGVALIAASLLPIAGAAQAAPAQAKRFQDSARMLTHRAERAARSVARFQAQAAQQEQRAAALRAEARRSPAKRNRLLARADDLETSAAASRAKARSENTRASTFRAEARRMQRLAKVEATKPARAVPNAAKLHLRSTTPCKVTVDGRFVGYTPVAALKVSAGEHVITCGTLDGRSVRTRITMRERTVQGLTFDPK